MRPGSSRPIRKRRREPMSGSLCGESAAQIEHSETRRPRRHFGSFGNWARNWAQRAPEGEENWLKPMGDMVPLR
ncbi:MAG: hypothetical protein FD160_561 [Caulobacteraceae bacterium]|nr:MAG: hypothetical protein FD160_561 [Caulobacteraceae bacterium]